jgi:chemotaxis protein histidine kinase CheA
MRLAEKYITLFQNECLELSSIVIDSLQKLTINPKDEEVVLEKMLQAADTIIGGSRFINNKELEEASILLVNTFYSNRNLIHKSKELEFFIKIFEKIVNRLGKPQKYSSLPINL